MDRHNYVEGTAPFRVGPLPISSKAVEIADTCLQSYVASQYIRHKAFSGGPLGGLLDGSICLLILSHISMHWGPPKLKAGALGLQGTQRLVGPERQGTNTLGALDSLKGGLGL